MPSAAIPRLNQRTAHVEFRGRLNASPQPDYRTFFQPQERGIRLGGEDAILSEQGLMRRLADRDPARRRLAIQAVNDFGQLCGDLITGKRSMRLPDGLQLASTGSFPDPKVIGTLPTALVLGDNQKEVDLRWRQFYNVQDRRQQSHPYFEIYDVRHAIEFKVYQLGQRIEMRGVAAGNEIFKAEIVAGGLQWNQLWSEWQSIWATGDGLAEMQREYLMQMARTGYRILTADGLPTQSYVNRDGSGSQSIRNDIATINAATLAIRRSLYEKDNRHGGITREAIGNQTYYLLYNDLQQGYEDRITAALEARYTTGNDNMSVAEVNRPIVPVGTPDVPAGAWYVFLPGRKNIASVFRDLQVYDKMDVQVAGVAEGRVGQGAYKMVRADNEQGREIQLA